MTESRAYTAAVVVGGLLVAGALGLAFARAPAFLIDLATSAGTLLCF